MDDEEDDDYFSVEAVEKDETKEDTQSNCDTKSTSKDHPDEDHPDDHGESDEDHPDEPVNSSVHS